MSRFLVRAVFCLAVLLTASSFTATPAPIVYDFEDLPDSALVEDFYAIPHGVHFTNSIALTAGFTLNEIDYPPRSGVRVVGDIGGPIQIWFEVPMSSVSGWFTHGSSLTFTAYSDTGFTAMLGSLSSPGSNVGTSEFMELAIDGIFSVVFSTSVAETLTLDDLTLVEIPEPATAALVAGVLIALIVFGRRARFRGPSARQLMVIAVCSLVPLGLAMADQGVFNAKLTPEEAPLNQTVAVTVTAEVGADPFNPVIQSAVNVWQVTETGAPLTNLGRMYDDGTHGDVVAADTIFTTIVNVSANTPVSRYFLVSAAYTGVRTRYLSQVLTLSMYRPMPPEAADQAVAFGQGILNTFLLRIGTLGLAGARQDALWNAQNDPHVGLSNVNLTGEFLSWIYVFTDPATGLKHEIAGLTELHDPLSVVDSAGRSVPRNLPVGFKSPGNDKLMLWGPGYHTADPQNGIMDHAKSQFNDTEYMTFDPKPPVITANVAATLETVKTWGTYGTVIIHTHGGVWAVGATQQIVLLTGTAVSPANNTRYAVDLALKRIGVSGGHYFFAPSFVTRYMGSMKDTFFYIGACESLRNDTLWNALKAKGAKVGFGWSQTVERNFNTATFARLIDPMLPHDNTKDPLTAKDAFDAIPNKISPGGAIFRIRTASAAWEKFVFTEGGIVNGDFETGDWTGWTHGAALSDGKNYQLVVGARKHAGLFSGALGRWDSAYQGHNEALEPLGYEWFYQDFIVPPNATKLSFYWWLETYDTAIWDWFDAYLKDEFGSTVKALVTQGGKPGSNYGPYWNTGGWRYVETDVTAYRGKKMRIYFDQRLDGWGDQQRVYVDDVKVE